jgi:probable rRNA maturation factor
MLRTEPLPRATFTQHSLPEADVLVVAEVWAAEPQADVVIQRAIAAAANAAGSAEGDCELAVMLTDDTGIRTLNANWRGLDKATNVLSFPALAPASPPQPDDPPRMLGDIAIAYETTRREADEEGKTFADHLSHLAVHGYLHLVGYDHEDDADAETMEQLERDILASLEIADPYADRGGSE